MGVLMDAGVAGIDVEQPVAAKIAGFLEDHGFDPDSEELAGRREAGWPRPDHGHSWTGDT